MLQRLDPVIRQLKFRYEKCYYGNRLCPWKRLFRKYTQCFIISIDIMYFLLGQNGYIIDNKICVVIEHIRLIIEDYRHIMVLLNAQLIKNNEFKFTNMGVPNGWWFLLMQHMINGNPGLQYYQYLHNHKFNICTIFVQSIFVQSFTLTFVVIYFCEVINTNIILRKTRISIYPFTQIFISYQWLCSMYCMLCVDYYDESNSWSLEKVSYVTCWKEDLSNST